MSAADLMDFSPEIAEARLARSPMVALESTIVTHGMPYPRNVETVLAVEQAVRETGAVPATIAVIEGRLRVGLDDQEIDRLGQISGGVVERKLRCRDLAARPRPARRKMRLARLSRRPCLSLSSRASKSSPPAGSAASTAAPRRRSTSRLISSSFRAPASRLFAPAPNRSSTSARRSNSWRRREVAVVGYRGTGRVSGLLRHCSIRLQPNTAATGFTISPA